MQGELITRLEKSLGTAQRYQLTRKDEFPGILVLICKVDDDTWRLKIQLDSCEGPTLQIKKESGGYEDESISVILERFDRTPFFRPRSAGDASVPESIRFRRKRHIDAFGGDLLVEIKLYDDSPLSNSC